MNKNEEYEGKVKALGSNGEGIIDVEGTTVFVPFCLIGEEVSFKTLKVKGNIAYGKLNKVTMPSPERVPPVCSVFTKCGGCDLQHLSYSAQLNFKRNLVESSLLKIGGITHAVNPTVPCDKEYGYRNKLALPIGVLNGNTVIGFYAPHSHRIVPINSCPIQSEWCKDVIQAVNEFIKTGVEGYDEERETGVLRHIVVREIKGSFVFALVAAKRINLSPLVEILKKKFASFTLLLNVNPRPTNAIFGDSFECVYGSGFFDAEEQGVKYGAGANTFLQVNDDVREKLYSFVLGNAPEGATAIDLYSGGGMLTAMLAKKCGKAYGIEIVPEATRCANELKDKNGLQEKMINICGKVEDNVTAVLSEAAGKKIIVCDPPRKGMERSVVKAVAAAEADKIILISCNPATLARDLGLLCGTLKEEDGGLIKNITPVSKYKIESITPFDMFPQTKHVETVVTLSLAKE